MELEYLFKKVDSELKIDFYNRLCIKDPLSNPYSDNVVPVTNDEFEKDSAIAGHYWAIAKHAFLLGLKAQKGE